MDAELQEKINKANGKRRNRIITAADVQLFEEVFNDRKEDPAVNRIRVYPAYGFVANSYRFRAEVTYIEARRDAETKAWEIVATTGDAKRSYGAGARVTVNGRAI